MMGVRTKLIGVVLGLALCAIAALAEVAVELGDLPAFHQVNPRLYRGGQPTRDGIQMLARLGVKTIINLREPDEDSRAEEFWVREAGLRYLNFPMEGTGRPTNETVNAVLTRIQTRPDQPVFLHCKRGKDRTGVIVACYRIAYEHWSAEAAVKEARQLGMHWSEFAMQRYIRDFYRAHLWANRQAHTNANRSGLGER
jgi:tyrosine-protein phosphatase SIW14